MPKFLITVKLIGGVDKVEREMQCGEDLNEEAIQDLLIDEGQLLLAENCELIIERL